MLEFFRKHQRYFFLIITVVIVISFSFFGTYGAMMSDRGGHEEVVFTAVDGTPIMRSELDEMTLFISTDSGDKLLFGGIWGPNFLNDGVIRRDILSTGFAEQIITAYPDLISEELLLRFAKEKHFVPYTHPQAQFLSIENAWSYFIPEIKKQFDILRSATNPLTSAAIAARISLYLESRKLPPAILRQIMLYQEKQYPWLTHDPNLEAAELAVFNYHTIQDWFGARFLQLTAEVIINSAKLAEKKGYIVTREEALASLWRNAELSFQENSTNPHIGVTSVEEYFREQLRRLNLDMGRATKLWQQILLFRRLFEDASGSAFVDPLFMQQFAAYANDRLQGVSYRLPEPLHLGDFSVLQQFETYLDKISKRSLEDKASLALPKIFLSAEELLKSSPELVQKRYLIEISSIDKAALEEKISLKDSWAWEIQEDHWQMLQKQFPELGMVQAQERAERFAALDKLSEAMREKVDAYARAAIVDSHPAWIEEALAAQEPTKEIISIRLKGGRPPLAGVEKREKLMELLETADKAPVAKGSDLGVGVLDLFTADNKIYYKIRVIDRSRQWEPLLFAEAKNYGVIEQLVNSQLEAYYRKIREGKEKEFRREDGSWSPFVDVKNKVAEDYFAKVLAAIRENYALNKEAKYETMLTVDQAAPFRLYPYVKAIHDQLQAGDNASEALIPDNDAESQKEQDFLQQPSLEKQWFLHYRSWQIERSLPSKDKERDLSQAFSFSPGQWSSIIVPPNGDLSFFRVVAKESGETATGTEQQTVALQRLVGGELQSKLMQQAIALFKEKQAISL